MRAAMAMQARGVCLHRRQVEWDSGCAWHSRQFPWFREWPRDPYSGSLSVLEEPYSAFAEAAFYMEGYSIHIIVQDEQ